MVAAAILAGGSGKRFGAPAPKQYTALDGVPVLVRSVRAFLEHPEVDVVAVAVPEGYVEETEALFEQWFGGDRVRVLTGGGSRSETLLRTADFFAAFCPADTVFLTHDAVRPFVTARIISENIAAARIYGAAGTVMPAVDTVLLSESGEFIGAMPPRKTVFHAQTPQSFRLGPFRALLCALPCETLAALTDGCSACVRAGEPVYMVRGEPYNIKITYPEDLERGEDILRRYFCG